MAHALKKRTHLEPIVKLRLDRIAEYAIPSCFDYLALILVRSLFERLTTCVERKLEQGTTRRIIEPNTDISEVKSLLLLLSARIEAFIVSLPSVMKTVAVLTHKDSTRAQLVLISARTQTSRYAV